MVLGLQKSHRKLCYSPTLCKVGPIGHDHSTEHDVIPGEVTGEQISRAHHGDAKYVGHLIAMCRVRPHGLHKALAVVIEGVEVCGRAVAGVQVSCYHRWLHPLVVSEERNQGLPPGLRVILVSPVCVHEFNRLSECVLPIRVAVQTVHEIRHGEVKVVAGHAVLQVHQVLHKAQPLALIHTQHDVVVEELALLHQDLRVIGDNVSVDDGAEGHAVAGGLDVLLHELLGALLLQAGHHVHRVQHVAANPLSKHASVLDWLIVDGPAGQR